MPDELKKASGDTSATPAAVAAGMVRWLNEGERIETTWNLTAFLSPELFLFSEAREQGPGCLSRKVGGSFGTCCKQGSPCCGETGWEHVKESSSSLIDGRIYKSSPTHLIYRPGDQGSRGSRFPVRHKGEGGDGWDSRFD